MTQPAITAITTPRRRARRLYFLVGGLAVAAVAAFAIHHFLTADEVSTDNAQVEGDVVPLAVRVSGTVQKVLVSDHQAVRAGQVLAEIDRVPLEIDQRRAEAELEAARARLAAAAAEAAVAQATSQGGRSSATAQVAGSSAAVRTAAAQIRAADANVARAVADRDRTQSDLARARSLAAKGAVTSRELEQAVSAAAQAAAVHAAAVASATAAREQAQLARTHVAEARGHLEESGTVDQKIAAADAYVALSRAGVEIAEAQVARARLAVADATVKAPTAGLVSRLAIHAGQAVQPGQRVADLVPTTTYVVANLKETDVARVAPGQEATVEIDAYPGRSFTAKVAAVAGATGARFSLLPPDNATGNYVKVVQRVPVRLDWAPPPDVPLRPGFSVEVTIDVGD